jgi:hypothetical protein
MIADSDSVELASGVSVANGYLEDAVRRCSWPLNDTGVFVLGRAGRPLEAVARELADAFCLPVGVARRDVLQFVWALNTLALVNIAQSGSRFRRSADWLGLAARLAPAGALPTPITRRRALDTQTVRRGFVSTFRASAHRALATAAAATVALVPLAIAAGGRIDVLALALALGTGSGIGLGLHEAGHAASLSGIPSALVLHGRRTFVLHAPLCARRRALVAISGPGVVVVVGLVLVAVGAAIVAPALVILGLPLAAHALSLTVVGGDGRSACGI